MINKIIIIFSVINLFLIVNTINAQTIKQIDSIKFIRYEKALKWIKSDDSLKIINFNLFRRDTTENYFKVSDYIMDFNVSDFADEIMDYEFKNGCDKIRDFLEIGQPPIIVEKNKKLARLNDCDSVIRKKLGDIPCDSIEAFLRNSRKAMKIDTTEYWNYGIFFSRIIKNRLRASIVPNRRVPLCLRFYLPIENSDDCEILFYFDDNNNIIKVFRKCFTN